MFKLNTTSFLENSCGLAGALIDLILLVASIFLVFQ
ncbi:hypothetical protein Alsa1_CDS0043 [Staphylococcus phage Alsa_1]|nr:hypothetical protein Alsa1_CDS0043 [Staphylococcus phage Alsa_1]WNM50636.1 hypothetical protein Alsa2_CDS0022 [Staphylococcus phage Alsa_2]